MSSLRRKTDIAWDHCTLCASRTMKCNYCGKKMSGGGIHRMKEHLAKKKGDTSGCPRVPSHVQYQMESDLKTYKAEKRKKTMDTPDTSNEPSSYQQEAQDHHFFGEQADKISTSRGNITNFFPPSGPGTQPSIRSVLADKKVVEALDFTIARWVYDSCIPFNALNSPYFQKIIDGAASIGLGYKAPTYHAIRTRLFEKNVADINEYVDSFRKLWEISGCTIMADGWTDSRQRTLINFLVYCPEGTIFIKSVDASEHSKTSEMLLALFKEVVDFIGPKNVVHFVTDNASNYASAGKQLKKYYGHIYWTPCAAHCIDLMLEKFDELPSVKHVIEDGRKITKFIYNHVFVLHLMRKFCKGDLLRPANTRFATNFLSLQSLLEHKDDLFAMVACKEWQDHKISKTKTASEVREKIISSVFWNACQVLCKVTEPLVKVLRMVDSDEKPSMGYIFEGMRRAKEAIKEAFGGNVEDYKLYLDIVDDKWEHQLGHDLHAAGFILNPHYFYQDPIFATNYKLWACFLTAAERMYFDDESAVDKITIEFESYRKALDGFSLNVAIRNRDKMAPALWWQTFGGCAPHLQAMAIRILSQTCSASGCERNWSLFERIHTKKRNRLEHKRLNDLVFIQYNLRLREKGATAKVDPISLEAMSLFDGWIEEPLLNNDEDTSNWIDDQQCVDIDNEGGQ